MSINGSSVSINDPMLLSDASLVPSVKQKVKWTFEMNLRCIIMGLYFHSGAFL